MKSNDKLGVALKALSPDIPVRSDLLQALSGRLDKVDPLRQEREALRRAFRQGTVFGLILGILATLWFILSVLFRGALY